MRFVDLSKIYLTAGFSLLKRDKTLPEIGIICASCNKPAIAVRLGPHPRDQEVEEFIKNDSDYVSPDEWTNALYQICVKSFGKKLERIITVDSVHIRAHSRECRASDTQTVFLWYYVLKHKEKVAGSTYRMIVQVNESNSERFEALDVLKDRYSKGEITKKEYDVMVEDICYNISE